MNQRIDTAPPADDAQVLFETPEPTFGVVGLQDSVVAVVERGGYNDYLVRFAYDGKLLTPVKSELSACSSPYTYTARPSGQNGLSVAFACVDGTGPLGEVVYSGDGIERTKVIQLAQPPTDHSWDLARNEVWVSFSSRLCATIGIVDVTTGEIRQPNLAIDGRPVVIEPVESMISGRGCETESMNIDHATISPNGEFLAAMVSVNSAGHTENARLEADKELVVFRIADGRSIYRSPFDEIHELAWNQRSDRLALVGRRDSEPGLFLASLTGDDPPPRVVSDYGGPVSWSPNDNMLIIVPLVRDDGPSSFQTVPASGSS